MSDGGGRDEGEKDEKVLIGRKRVRGPEDAPDAGLEGNILTGEAAARARLLALASRGGKSTMKYSSEGGKGVSALEGGKGGPLTTDSAILEARHEFLRNESADVAAIAAADALAAKESARVRDLMDHISGLEETGSVVSEAEKKALEKARSDAAAAAQEAWELRLARRAYGKLKRDVVIVDLSQGHTGCVKVRWRTPHEALVGKGQFTCAQIDCQAQVGLSRIELALAYQEKDKKKAAAVTAVLCPKCAKKANEVPVE